MKNKYEPPEIKGPIECLKGTISLSWENKKKTVVSQDYAPMLTFPNPGEDSALSFRDEEFGGLVFNPITDRLYECNNSAAFIMKQLDGTHNTEEVAQMMANAFDIKLELAVKDLDIFIRKYVCKEDI